MDGYWRDDLSQAKRTAILADWADELEDWPVPSIQAALRKWRRLNPNKKPNAGHILQLLNEAWGRHNADQVRAATSATPEHQGMTAERHAAVSADLAARFPGLIKPMPQVRQ